MAQPGTAEEVRKERALRRSVYGPGLHRPVGVDSMISPKSRIASVMNEHNEMIGIATGAHPDFFKPAHSEISIFMTASSRINISVAPAPMPAAPPALPITPPSPIIARPLSPAARYEHSVARVIAIDDSKNAWQVPAPAAEKSCCARFCDWVRCNP